MKLVSDKEGQVYTGGALDIMAEAAAPSASDESVDLGAAAVRAKVRSGLFFNCHRRIPTDKSSS